MEWGGEEGEEGGKKMWEGRVSRRKGGKWEGVWYESSKLISSISS